MYSLGRDPPAVSVLRMSNVVGPQHAPFLIDRGKVAGEHGVVGCAVRNLLGEQMGWPRRDLGQLGWMALTTSPDPARVSVRRHRCSQHRRGPGTQRYVDSVCADGHAFLSR